MVLSAPKKQMVLLLKIPKSSLCDSVIDEHCF
jgi:hypothetical protein